MEYRIATPDEVAKQFDWLIEQHKHDPLQIGTDGNKKLLVMLKVA